jgi:aspartate/methionine/tyrosine aminotransferase
MNLARSGMPRVPMSELGLSLDDITTVEPYDDGWRPVEARIAGRHGVDAASVLTTHACAMANHLAFAAFVEPGDDVVMEAPGYEPLVRLAEYFGARVVPVWRREENDWRLDPTEVRGAITPRTTLIVVSNLHNPTGAFDTDATLLEIARAASSAGAHVLADEVYLDFLYPRGVRTAARLAPNVVATGSMTKVFGFDALRFGWIIADPAITQRIRRLNDLFSVSTSHPAARIAFHALGRAGELIARANARLEENLERVDAFVTAEPRLSWVRPVAGTIGWVRVDGLDAGELSERLLREDGVATVPGRFFGSANYIRIGWSLEREDLDAALETIRRHLSSHQQA